MHMLFIAVILLVNLLFFFYITNLLQIWIDKLSRKIKEFYETIKFFILINELRVFYITMTGLFYAFILFIRIVVGSDLDFIELEISPIDKPINSHFDNPDFWDVTPKFFKYHRKNKYWLNNRDILGSSEPFGFEQYFRRRRTPLNRLALRIDLDFRKGKMHQIPVQYQRLPGRQLLLKYRKAGLGDYSTAWVPPKLNLVKDQSSQTPRYKFLIKTLLNIDEFRTRRYTYAYWHMTMNYAEGKLWSKGVLPRDGYLTFHNSKYERQFHVGLFRGMRKWRYLFHREMTGYRYQYPYGPIYDTVIGRAQRENRIPYYNFRIQRYDNMKTIYNNWVIRKWRQFSSQDLHGPFLNGFVDQKRYDLVNTYGGHRLKYIERRDPWVRGTMNIRYRTLFWNHPFQTTSFGAYGFPFTKWHNYQTYEIEPDEYYFDRLKEFLQTEHLINHEPRLYMAMCMLGLTQEILWDLVVNANEFLSNRTLTDDYLNDWASYYKTDIWNPYRPDCWVTWNNFLEWEKHYAPGRWITWQNGKLKNNLFFDNEDSEALFNYWFFQNKTGWSQSLGGNTWVDSWGRDIHNKYLMPQHYSFKDRRIFTARDWEMTVKDLINYIRGVCSRNEVPLVPLVVNPYEEPVNYFLVNLQKNLALDN